MHPIFIFLLGTTFGLVICVAVIKWRQKRSIASPPSRGATVGVQVALSDLNAKRVQEKEIAKVKIMEMAVSRVEISNNEVEKLLGVSDATATRYLEELESEGKLIQVGIEGRFVRYRRATNGSHAD